MASVSELVPSFDALLRVAPLTTIILGIAAIGFVAGWKSRDPHIDTLKEWLNDFRKKPNRNSNDVDD